MKHKPDIVHVLAQYRTASPREFAIALTSKLMGIPFVYEVKAGVFIPWYTNTNGLFRSMVRYCLKRANVILCQGMPYVIFLKEQLRLDAHFYPNFVPSPDLPESIPNRLEELTIRILFVGFAYEGKGVFELVKACIKTAPTVPIQMTFVGKLAPDFKKWLDQTDLGEQLTIIERGVLPKEEVMEEFKKNDLYCYPTRHKGEGHNNSINEAMMHGLVIITTRQGFLGSILDSETCYFLNAVDENELTEVLLSIEKDRPAARQKAKGAHQHLLENYTSNVAFAKLEKIIRHDIKPETRYLVPGTNNTVHENSKRCGRPPQFYENRADSARF